MQNDEILFVAEDQDTGAPATPPWKVLIVDDEPEVHEVTRLALKNFEYAKRGLTFASAFSGSQARDLLAEGDDYAVALVDVIMEEDDAGLKLVRYIRETLKDKRLRIVLRTGQPGLNQEQDVMVAYEINDYKAKTELTRAKLQTTLVSSLRTVQYIDDVNALHERLRLANKLSVVGELSLGLFHEIATPLTVIMSANELIAEMVREGPSGIASHAAKIDRGCRRIMALTKSLKEFAWSGAEQVGATPIKTLFQGALDMCATKLRLGGVVAETLLQDPGATMVCSPRQMEQVLINLVNNACDALQPLRNQEKRVVLYGETSPARAVIEIRDNGPGVPVELRDKIFQSFFTTKERGQGTGLGLSICMGILDNIGGKLELGEAPGGGACFRIVVAR